MSIITSRLTLTGVPLLVARDDDVRSSHAVLWYPGYRASAAANEAELVRIASAGFVAVGVDAVGHGERAQGDPDERIPSHPRGALGVMLDLARATLGELPALIDALIAAGLSDTREVAVVGISMGAFIAYRAPLVAPSVRTVVALLGSPEWPDDDGSAHLHADRFRDIALLSVTAECDLSVPPAAARRFHERLARARGERYLELKGAGHLMSSEHWEQAMTATLSWLTAHHRPT